MASPFECGARLSAPVLKCGASSAFYDTATRATARSYSSLPLEGAHRRPKQIDSRVRSIARRFAQGTQAFAGTAGEKRALLPPKTTPRQKKAANSEEFAAIWGLQRAGHPVLKRRSEGSSVRDEPLAVLFGRAARRLRRCDFLLPHDRQSAGGGERERAPHPCAKPVRSQVRSSPSSVSPPGPSRCLRG